MAASDALSMVLEAASVAAEAVSVAAVAARSPTLPAQGGARSVAGCASARCQALPAGSWSAGIVLLRRALPILVASASPCLTLVTAAGVEPRDLQQQGQQQQRHQQAFMGSATVDSSSRACPSPKFPQRTPAGPPSA